MHATPWQSRGLWDHAAFVSLAAPGASAQQAASDTLLTIQHFLDWETVADPQISPDGARVLYTRRWVNKLEDRWESEVWLMDADGSRQIDSFRSADRR